MPIADATKTTRKYQTGDIQILSYAMSSGLYYIDIPLELCFQRESVNNNISSAQVMDKGGSY